MVNHSGSCSASANETILANGFKFSSLTFSAEASIIAEAPSLIVLAFAAVTVPVGVKPVSNQESYPKIHF